MPAPTRLLAVLGAAVVCTVGAVGFAAPANATDTGAPSTGFIQGFDVSDYQTGLGADDFTQAYSYNARFVFIKSGGYDSATTDTPSDAFDEQWADAGTTKLVRGIYGVIGEGDGTHAADPIATADAFSDDLGTLLKGSNTLAPVMDLEEGASTTCWMKSNADWSAGLAANQKTMVAWLQSFVAEMKKRTGRYPIIYTNQDWWNTCTGGSTAFTADKLWMADPSSAAKPTLPKGWSSYSFWQWRSGASSSTHAFPGDQDVFHGTTAQLQSLLTPLPSWSATISGTPQVGQRLTASATGLPSGAALSYQWYAGSTAIGKATSSYHTVSASDYGKAVTVKIAANASGYAPATKQSASAGTVRPGALKPGTVSLPTATPRVGVAITPTTSGWPSGAALGYQWYANGSTAIGGATAKSYTPTPSMYGKKLSVTVTGTQTGYTAGSTTASESAATAAGILTAHAPTVSGTAAVGSTLTASTSGWTAGTTISWQWLANGADLAGATSARYPVPSSVKGERLTVRATGTKKGYGTVSKLSAATSAVR